MLNFSQASLLSYAHQPVSFDAGLRYKIVKNITVNGFLLDLSNTSGVSGIYNSSQNFLTGAIDYSPVYINNIYFGQGKILSINLDQGNSVQQQAYTVGLEIYDSGNLFNAVSGYYSGVNWTNQNLIDTLSESFSYSTDDLNTKQYSHSINLRFNSGSNLPDTPINLAKNFASGLFAAANLTGFIGDYRSIPNKKRYYSENYNLITQECGFEEKVTVLTNDSGYYSHNYEHNISTDQNGITNVSEQGQVKGLVDNIYSAALSGFNEQKPLIYPRVSGVFAVHIPTTAYSLKPKAIEISNQINRFNGTIGYSYQFTNDPRINDLYSHEYSLDINTREDNVTEISERGVINGFGRPLVDKYPNAVNGYNIVKPTIMPRISGYYLSNVSPTFPLTKINESLNRNEFQGAIEYNIQCTDDTIYVNTSGIKKEEIDVETSYPVHLVNKFNIINVKELAQPANTSTVGQRSVKVNLLGARATTLDTYVNYAKSKIANYSTITGGAADGYMSSLTYTLSPNDNNFSMSANFNFHGNYKSFEDISMT